eukprot:TRINITY_DN36087_c0_g1_i1.p1 TRINITY_DN36087_c0_g1~~TRINITY_DN36087_c0_g1_i1.p1  ORF type:complete len:124 (-),score=39.92 TRINITY_DN36087_c0_g1_i1:120-467(-)
MEMKTKGLISDKKKRKSLRKERKHKSLKNPHKNLSKKHLQMWMTAADNIHPKLFSMVEDSMKKLRELERKQEYESCPCAEIDKKIENIDKTVEEERDARDKRDEAEDIIVASLKD